ncbi:transcriptional regulator [Streptomyces sp. NPDC005904]|uniref:transcriptional regulator n=1 Tax=Streptomyces sp. NPDC005904 TaxID=3154570 RepID=UPI0033D34D38
MAARPLVARQPNERLQALIQEAGCSNAGLARRVNMCGAEHGLDLRYDKTSVARWLRGQQPRGRAPGIIAEALGRKLGRTVTIDEIGMANGKNLASGVGLQFSPTVLGAIEQVCELWRSDVGRRDFLSGSTVAASALVEPSRDWLISSPDAQVGRTAGPRVGMADVAAVKAMTEALTRLDHQYGSGHVRPVVVHYLNSVVSGLLAGSYREAVGRELFAAVARLTELAGYMAVDTGQPGLAQRYYIQALRLAQAAGEGESGDDPVWIRHFDHAYLADEMAHCHRDLGQADAAARSAQESLDGHPETRARRRAIGLVLLATAQVQRREVEQACHTGLRAVELLGTLRSNRGAEYLEDFQQRLEPFREEPVVREFGARLDVQAA